MASTAFSTKIPLTNELVALLRPKRHRLFLLFTDPKLRPPVLDEMMPDLQRVIASVAQDYCDTTTPHLHFDELMGEGNLKLAEIITKGILISDKCPTRHSFFAFFKTAVNNHTRSRVQKYRFTEKRTGQKPPPREQRFVPNAAPAEDEAAPDPKAEAAKPAEAPKAPTTPEQAPPTKDKGSPTAKPAAKKVSAQLPGRRYA